MKITYREAIRRGLHDALVADPRVFLMGEDVGKYGGSYAVSKGFLDEFGPERIRDTPLSELAFVGAGIGAALGGMRPIVEVMTVNFSLLALDQIVNTAALYRHMSGGQFSVPVVIRMATGAGRQLAAQHSHSLENWYAHVPGITVLAPATIDDARGMLAPALADPDPVVIFEHALLYNFEGELTDAARDVDIRSAKILRAGTDVTLIAYGGTVWKALDAAQELAADGIEAEVLDLRVLRPLDDATIMASVRRTRRAVVIDEGWRTGSLAGEVMARIVEQAFYDLDAPLARVCSEEVPIPYAKHLEDAALPQVPRIVAAVRRMLGRREPMIEFKLPSLGAEMDEGTLLEWKVKPGDPVKKGDVVAVVDTSKSAIDVEIWETGTIWELVHEPPEVLPVGTVIARLLEPGETPEHAEAEKQRKAAEIPPRSPATPAPVTAAPARRARVRGCRHRAFAFRRRQGSARRKWDSTLPPFPAPGRRAPSRSRMSRRPPSTRSTEGPRRRDAQRDRRRDGALEAGDPTLLSRDRHSRSRAPCDGSRRATRAGPSPSVC